MPKIIHVYKEITDTEAIVPWVTVTLYHETTGMALAYYDNDRKAWFFDGRPMAQVDGWLLEQITHFGYLIEEGE